MESCRRFRMQVACAQNRLACWRACAKKSFQSCPACLQVYAQEAENCSGDRHGRLWWQHTLMPGESNVHVLEPASGPATTILAHVKNNLEAACLHQLHCRGRTSARDRQGVQERPSLILSPGQPPRCSLAGRYMRSPGQVLSSRPHVEALWGCISAPAAVQRTRECQRPARCAGTALINPQPRSATEMQPCRPVHEEPRASPLK